METQVGDPSTSRSLPIPSNIPHIFITEQPQPRALRFRYLCENRGSAAGSIPGVSSSNRKRTYPTIEIRGYLGRVKVIVSCVTSKEPYQPHPHKLVGRDGCENGVCTVYVSPETDMRLSLNNIGIQCVRRMDVDREVSRRLQHYCGPFTTEPGTSTAIDLNSLRLCFQAFLETGPDQFTCSLHPVLSDVIYDKKAKPDLTICDLSDCSAPLTGGKRVIMLCEKISKDDIRVRFFQDRPGRPQWQAFGKFQPATDVHKQVAIAFETPAYDDTSVDESVMVKIQLQRISDNAVSEALNFELHPSTEVIPFKRKRKLSEVDEVSSTNHANHPEPSLILKPPLTEPVYMQYDPNIGSIHNSGYNQPSSSPTLPPFQVIRTPTLVPQQTSDFDSVLQDVHLNQVPSTVNEGVIQNIEYDPYLMSVDHLATVADVSEYMSFDI